ncbi:glycan-binding surface protein [Olivibacter jilunii]|uniref:glycan-binding surface protein n=1 Tax=Olivibacter jilunii TaxID=985016 RepID=UPI003F1805B0
MKTFNFFHQHILLWIALIGIAAFIACSKKDAPGGTPEIYSVRLTDPTKADSTFTGAFPGRMIAVIGNNLGGIQKIYINDQEVSFNTNYCTATSAIFTIPGDLILTGTNPELSNEIRIETNRGVAKYAFHIYSPAPEIHRITLKYPATPGENLKIFGANFYEIQKVVFESTTGTSVGVLDYTVSNDYNIIDLTIPPGVQDGRLVVYCYTDSVSIPFSTNVAPPTIKTFSSDMPIIGDLAYITGDYFIDVTSLNINGEFTIPASDLLVSNSNDTLYFRLPKAPSKGGVVTITAAGGNSNSPKAFYPIENVVLNWDNIGAYSWGDNNEAVVADGSKVPYVSTGTCYRIFGKPGAWQYWWGNLSNDAVYPTTNIIPANTPIENLALRFECYMSESLAPASFEIQLKGNGDQMVVDYLPKDKNSNKAVTGKWITCDIALSKFTAATDYAGFAAIANTGLGIFTKNKSDNADVNVDVYFDNFRIVDITK